DARLRAGRRAERPRSGDLRSLLRRGLRAVRTAVGPGRDDGRDPGRGRQPAWRAGRRGRDRDVLVVRGLLPRRQVDAGPGPAAADRPAGPAAERADGWDARRGCVPSPAGSRAPRADRAWDRAPRAVRAWEGTG